MTRKPSAKHVDKGISARTQDVHYDIVYRDQGWDVSGPKSFRARSLGEAEAWVRSRHKRVKAMQRSTSPSGSVAFRVGACASL
jgi:hypothetical protein